MKVIILPPGTKLYLCKLTYYISKLVRALWLVNLAGRTLLHGPLKFIFVVALLLRDLYRQIFSTYIANKSLKLSFTLNYVLKRSNNLKMISNLFVFLSTCFRNLKLFLMIGNRSQTRQTHNRDIINILLTREGDWKQKFCKEEVKKNILAKWIALSGLQPIHNAVLISWFLCNPRSSGFSSPHSSRQLSVVAPPPLLAISYPNEWACSQAKDQKERQVCGTRWKAS